MILIGVLDSGRRAGPGVPNIGTATDVGTARAFNNGAATVTFTAGSGVTPTSYTVKAYNNADVYQGISATGASSPITITGLASSTIYKFTVYATAGSNSSAESAFSNTITATTIPQAPTIGTATAGSASATVAYTANATGGQTVTYTATSNPGSFTGTGASPITVSGLTNGTAYTFTVTAANANGSATSAASNSVTPVTPQYIITGTVTQFTRPGTEVYSWSSNGFGSRTFTSDLINNSDLASTQTHIAVTQTSARGSVRLFTNGVIDNQNTGLLVGASTSSGTMVSVGLNPAVSAIVGGWRTGSAGSRMVAAPYSTATGIGTKYADPVPSITTVVGFVTFSSSGNEVGMSGNGSSVQIFPFSASTGFGTKYSGGTAATVGGGLKWSPNNAVVVMVTGADNISAYPWSSGYGSKYANPVSGPTVTNETGRVAWSPNGNSVAFSTPNSPFIYVYPWSSGFGTKYADPATSPGSNGRSLAFSKPGNAIGIITNTTVPYIFTYPWNPGFGTKYADIPQWLTENTTTFGTSLNFAQI